MVKVELVYVAQDKGIFHQYLQLNDGATVFDALSSTGIYQLYPETKESSVGIFSKLVSLDHVLHDGDRLEVYRPLSLDPKEKRKIRAKRM